ncbi:RluA family pseudouridine synthase [Sphingobacterium sp. WM]|uniref:RluA family pseudouridine synthase n=1 Tax=Sphingobacterium sp. WM TaxID=3031802 RepID=UPI00240E71B0|nr:RluA family pseudouridine synthase [Sphingobacterium sp. WM]WFB61944.1 RluA family pseudouridine synthase [Sphingobacterium sp. WM]
MSKEIPYFHLFQEDTEQIILPSRFTFPFCYEPHELSKLAAQQVQDYLMNQQDFDHNFGLDPEQSGLIIGKMFGVLVLRDQHGQLGFLAAVSGKLAGTNRHNYFVPPIFDMLDPEGFFLKEEEIINQINRDIEKLQNSTALKDLKTKLASTRAQEEQALADMRALHKKNKAERKAIRNTHKESLSIDEYKLIEEDLIKQSYRDQHHYDVQKELSARNILQAETELNEILNQIDLLKQERKLRSSNLQNELFDQYHFLNANQQRKSVLDIFKDSKNIIPPAGAGECAAPKLLQYAFEHNLNPISMAEFWWGSSPNQEVRKHQNFYPACRGKCEPILEHMLQGLSVDPNPMLENPADGKELEIIFEDEAIIVVNKPAEFLSVPGINVQDSVQSRIMAKYPNLDSPLIIHRLDMSTSGILVLAKTKEAHQFIQSQFINHTVKKRYTALLDGIIQQPEGLIDLPLRVDLDDRPRQVVCYEYGKPAQTEYKIVAIEGQHTRIHYFPQTGRTHQLRVHSAHAKGLNCAIIGDDLYGKRANRLHLHAGYIQFIHPHSKASVSFEVSDPF